jgi:hypothetical protein
MITLYELTYVRVEVWLLGVYKRLRLRLIFPLNRNRFRWLSLLNNHNLPARTGG